MRLSLASQQWLADQLAILNVAFSMTGPVWRQLAISTSLATGNCRDGQYTFPLTVYTTHGIQLAIAAFQRVCVSNVPVLTLGGQCTIVDFPNKVKPSFIQGFPTVFSNGARDRQRQCISGKMHRVARSVEQSEVVQQFEVDNNRTCNLFVNTALCINYAKSLHITSKHIQLSMLKPTGHAHLATQYAPGRYQQLFTSANVPLRR